MQIIVAPDSRLNQISKKVEVIDDSIISTLNQMLECMYQNNGIGLAAPQVGILKRLVVIDCSDNEDIKKPLKLINPEITKSSKNEPLFAAAIIPRGNPNIIPIAIATNATAIEV